MTTSSIRAFHPRHRAGYPGRRGIPLRSLGLADRNVRALRTRGWLRDDGTAVLKTADLPAVLCGDLPHRTADELFTALITLVAPAPAHHTARPCI